MNIPTPKYILVENHIKKAIKNKSIVDKLPGERTLAKELGFSYMTIRKAIDNLVNDGVLFKIPTKGTFVTGRNKNGKKNTRTIGYFLDSSIISGISSPYYSLIFNAIEKEAAKHNYSVVYFSDISENKLRKILKKLDGVIATCFPRIESIIQEMKQSVSVVVIDNSASDKSIPSVIIDNFNADVESVDYITSLGHDHIGYLTGLEDSDVGKNRYAGYLNGLNKNNIDFDKAHVFRGNYSFYAGIQGAEYFLSLEKPPSAVICANDSMALGAIKKFHQSGLNVPKDISIIGFDDIEVASQIVPALTTIAAPVDEIARRAFYMLEQLIQGKELDNKHVALAAHLVIRQTCSEPGKKTAAA
ncbi:MAG: substrate-binding domain-containing protein [Gammaproteobacteria bacterium]|nr:substrate-binding domain-containing protein [Gammaproteobacteria bacterium]